LAAPADAASEILRRLVAARGRAKKRCFILGIAGAQGSGKTTLARELVLRLEQAGDRATALSLDDFYLTRAKRREIAATVSPIMAMRGPPGTHDLPLALETLRAIRRGADVRAPVFDKGADDRRVHWREIGAPIDIVVLEGWCLCATPQPSDALAIPVNMLERVFDQDGAWRRAVNASLRDYQALFAEVDYLAYLRPPSFDVVHGWRAEQERNLRGESPAAMRIDELSFFIQHYERLTRHMMTEIPARAHLTLHLDARRRIVGVSEPRWRRPENSAPPT
jgi:D-glycerate 3-kinase